jgi:hypothetical protein
MGFNSGSRDKCLTGHSALRRELWYFAGSCLKVSVFFTSPAVLFSLSAIHCNYRSPSSDLMHSEEKGNLLFAKFLASKGGGDKSFG